jgi:hypothetical protein
MDGFLRVIRFHHHAATIETIFLSGSLPVARESYSFREFGRFPPSSSTVTQP